MIATPTGTGWPTRVLAEATKQHETQDQAQAAPGAILDTTAVSRQLPNCRCGRLSIGRAAAARRVQSFNNDPRLERALSMAETTCTHDSDPARASRWRERCRESRRCVRPR